MRRLHLNFLLFVLMFFFSGGVVFSQSNSNDMFSQMAQMQMRASQASTLMTEAGNQNTAPSYLNQRRGQQLLNNTINPNNPNFQFNETIQMPLSRIEQMFFDYDDPDVPTYSMKLPELIDPKKNEKEQKKIDSEESETAYASDQSQYMGVGYPVYNPAVMGQTTLPGQSLDSTKSSKPVKEIVSTANKMAEQKRQQEEAKRLKLKAAARQFGYELFEDAFQSPMINIDIPVGPDYVLGPGDHLIVRFWGKLNETMELTLDREGKTSLPRVGDLNLAGVTFGRAPSVIRQAMSREYTNFDLSVTMGRMRVMKVFVLGAVARPGAYDISALSTAFMALYSAGGPTKEGTMRRIQIKRYGRTAKEMDLYAYLLYGDRSQDPQLEPFDTVFVPSIGDVVKIDGMVKRPAIFEVSPQTSLYQCINTYAGGLGSYAYHKRIQLRRVDNGERRQYLDLSWEDDTAMYRQWRNEVVKGGDSIYIFPMLQEKRQFVEVAGNVFRPGIYGYESGLTLKTLFNLADGLKPGSYLKRVDVYRYIDDNKRTFVRVDYDLAEGAAFVLQDHDVVRVYSETEVLGEPYVEVEGAVKNLGRHRLLDAMTIADLAIVSGLEIDADLTNCELYRINKDGNSCVIPFNLQQLLQTPESTQNMQLQHRDHLFVRFNTNYIGRRRIEVTGQVPYPGIYYARDGERLSSVLARAGGFTDKAFLHGAVFKRKTVQERESAERARILEDEKKRLIYDQSRLGAINEQTQFIFREAMSFLEKKINENAGRIVLEIQPLSKFSNSRDDILIEDGDSLFIPEQPSSVQVVGGVQQPTAIVYVADQNARYYIDQVGGFSEFADRQRIFIMKANGTVLRNATIVEPGDSVYVAEAIKVHVDWLDIVTKVATTTMGILTSYKILTSP